MKVDKLLRAVADGDLEMVSFSETFFLITDKMPDARNWRGRGFVHSFRIQSTIAEMAWWWGHEATALHMG